MACADHVCAAPSFMAPTLSRTVAYTECGFSARPHLCQVRLQVPECPHSLPALKGCARSSLIRACWQMFCQGLLALLCSPG